jgi:putative phosphoesterase
MRIGILSDTHDKVTPAHMETLKNVFKGVDRVLHAGDIYSSSLLDQLEEIAPVVAAIGNGDFILRDKRISHTHNLNFEGFALHLGHYFPFPDMELQISKLKRPWGNVNPEFDKLLSEHMRVVPEPPDIIVFGHTHRALVHAHDDVMIINPGSPTVPFQRNWRGSVVLLTLQKGKILPEIIRL